MLARRSDLVEVLRQPFAWDHNDEQSPGEDPFFSLPVIFDIGGHRGSSSSAGTSAMPSGTSRRRG